MDTIPVFAVPDGEERATPCSCCGRPIYEGCGELQTDDSLLADYWYRWSEGHEGRFNLAIGAYKESGGRIEGIAVVSGHVTATDVVYSVVEPEDSPWTDFGVFGPVLTRQEALHGPMSESLFHLVDAVAANEPRISSRILGCGLRA